MARGRSRQILVALLLMRNTVPCAHHAPFARALARQAEPQRVRTACAQIGYEVRDGYYVVAADGVTRFDGGGFPSHLS